MIRQATTQDLPAIVHVHRVCFANSYSSQLSYYQSVIGGGDLLISFYLEYMKDNPELFVVADDEEKGIVVSVWDTIWIKMIRCKTSFITIALRWYGKQCY